MTWSRVLFMLLASTLATGCGSKAQAGSTLEQAVKEQTERTKQCKDAGNRLLPDCLPVKLTWSKTDFVYPASRPVVLHIEPGVTDLLSLGKYRSRVKAYLKQDDTGTFTALDHVESAKTVSSGFRHVVADLLAPLSASTAASALNAVSGEFSEVFQQENDDVGEGLTGGHALMTLGIIGEYAPDATLVIASMRDHLPEASLCAKDFSAMRAYVKAAGDSLSAEIKALGVQFINMSGGDNRAALKAEVAALCSGVTFSTAELTQTLQILSGFYAALGGIDGTVLVQSAGAFASSGDATSTANPVDCPQTNFKHRLRVGYVDLAQSDIPSEGAPLADYEEAVPHTLRYGSRCVDIYVNSQTAEGRPGDHPAEVTVNGVGAYPLPFMYTSFAAPLVTARLVNLAATHPGVSPEQLAGELTGFGARQIQDPLQYGQFEVYRLGLRPAD